MHSPQLAAIGETLRYPNRQSSRRRKIRFGPPGSAKSHVKSGSVPFSFDQASWPTSSLCSVDLATKQCPGRGAPFLTGRNLLSGKVCRTALARDSPSLTIGLGSSRASAVLQIQFQESLRRSQIGPQNGISLFGVGENLLSARRKCATGRPSYGSHLHTSLSRMTWSTLRDQLGEIKHRLFQGNDFFMLL